MKLHLTLLPIAAAAIAIAASPALAKAKKHHHPHYGYYQGYYAAPYGPYPAGPGFVSRNVSDPSFGNRAGIDYARATGRCVVDLGYGRYEYCGW